MGLISRVSSRTYRKNAFVKSRLMPSFIAITFKYVFFTLISVYLGIAVLWLTFGGYLLPEIVYLHRLSISKYTPDHCDATKYLPKTKNIDIKNPFDNHLIPAWYTPKAANTQFKGTVVYAHGNSLDRCTPRRVGNYKQLAEFGFNVLSFDYGGFSNSTRTAQPTPNSLANDVISMVNYVRETMKAKGKLVVWAHSLGTGAAARAVKLHAERFSGGVDLLVLEAPFADGVEAAKEHPYAAPFRDVYGKALVEFAIDFVVKRAQLDKLASLENIASVGSKNWPKILLMHAEYDDELPIKHSDRILRELTKQEFTENGAATKLRYLRYTEREKFGHSGLMQGAAWQETVDCLLDENKCSKI